MSRQTARRIAPRSRSTLAALVLLLAGGACGAHHSYAMFDRSVTRTIHGTIRAFEWTNPHIYIWVDVPDGRGGSTVWGVEGGTPVMLARLGWSRNSLQPGDAVSVDLNPLRDQRPGGYFIALTRADGSKLGGDGVIGGARASPPAP